jgi:hypothetical protein
MKFLKILLGIIIALVAIFFIVGMFLPKTYSLSRSIVINAPDSVVYKNVADFNNFMKWNPWYKAEPTANVTIAGTPETVGHLYAWKGDNTGQGQMMITSLDTNKVVNEELKLIKPMEGLSDVKFTIGTAEGGVKVDWIMSGENKSITDKWKNMIACMMMKKDFENGLKDLKAMSEK